MLNMSLSLVTTVVLATVICLLSLLNENSYCNCNVFVYKITAEDYMVKFDRLEAQYPVPELYTGKIVTRRINRTTTFFDVYHNAKTTLNKGEIMLKAEGYQFLSNTYRLTSIQILLDYCYILEAGSFGVNDFVNHSEGSTTYPPKCPITPGNYLTKNGLLPTSVSTYSNTIPPNFMGKWKVKLDYQLRKKTLYIFNYYFEIIRSEHYWRKHLPKIFQQK